ncbi:MAG: glycosyltransferase family 2 protein [Bacteroidales bacterium]|jgi:dolichol-phosphate mannosyltransferase|nr:glycosyltransferase family 2 protein [Bacteroidales bacterium]
MLLSVIIPCYNEEAVIAETYKRLSAVMSNLLASSCEDKNDESSDEVQPKIQGYELVFINDGSRDTTFEILSEIAANDKNVKVLNFSRNFGHQCAVTAGLKHCQGDAAVIIDADLQDPPEVIVEMLKIMKAEKANVVYGKRKHRKGETWFKLLTAKLYYRFLNSLSDVKFPTDTGDFRLIDRAVIDIFNGLKEKNKYIRGLISWMGFKQVPCYYEREERFAGETHYPFMKMLKFAMTGLLYFSKKPLKIATTLGLFCVLLGIAYVIWMLISWLAGAEFVHGWFTTIAMIVFFGGVQLLTVGILGQYIGNIFDEAKNRPEYIIKDIVNE